MLLKLIKIKSLLFAVMICGALLCFTNCSRDDEPSSSSGDSSGSSSSSSNSSKKQAPTIDYSSVTSGGGEINIYFKVLDTEPEADVILEYGTSSNDLSKTKSCSVYYGTKPPKGYTIYRTHIIGSGKYYFRGKASNKYGSDKTSTDSRYAR